MDKGTVRGKWMIREMEMGKGKRSKESWYI